MRNIPVGNQDYDDLDVKYKEILPAYNKKQGDVFVVGKSYFGFDTSEIHMNYMIHTISLFPLDNRTNQSRVSVVTWTDEHDRLLSILLWIHRINTHWHL